MSIIDSIQLSGSSYDVRDKSATTVVSLTQQEYDALPSSAKTANILYNITDATAGDLTQYWTSAQTQSAITEAVSGKQDTLVSGTNIKTINNESILGSGNITIQGGGTDTGTVQTMIDQSISGKADSSTVTALTNTVTGHTADTSIHVTTAQTAAWDAKSDFSGSYNDLTNKLSAGTNITIVDNVISAEGGGGKAVTGGTNISVTTGETADTINCTLPIFVHSNSGRGDIRIGTDINANSDYYRLGIGRRIDMASTYGAGSIAIGVASNSTSQINKCYGGNNVAIGRNFQVGESDTSSGARSNCVVIGNKAKSLVSGGIAIGSDSVASGTTKTNINNQLTIDTSNQVYIYNKDNTEMICLQDQLGGGGSSYSAGTGIDITNDVISVTGKVDTTTYSTYTAATDAALATKQTTLTAGTGISIVDNVISATGGGTVESAITSGSTNAVAGGAVFDAVVYSGNTYTTELTFDADGYAENWIVGQSAITIDVSGYTSTTNADYYFQNSNGEDLGYANIHKDISTWWSSWNNHANNCTITTDGDTATTATITDIPSGTVKIRRMGVTNPPKAIISGDTPEIWIKDALDDHRDNTTVHITAAERTSWNNKSNFSGSYNDLTDKPIPDSALNVASTNPVQNQALYSELRIDNESGEAETTIEWSGSESTNYPNGCTKIKIEDITSMSQNTIHFFADSGSLGFISVSNWGSISVDTSSFQGATYEISGSTVIISYPTVTTVNRLDVGDSTRYTYKAITSSTTPLKDQVVANTTALGGLSLVKLTQAQYDALVTKDSNTLYLIVN